MFSTGAVYREGEQSPRVDEVKQLYSTLSFHDDPLYKVALQRFEQDASRSTEPLETI
jgi:hypothetical protein